MTTSRRCLPRMMRACLLYALLLLTTAQLLRFCYIRLRDLETGLSSSVNKTKPLRVTKSTLDSEKLPLQYAKNSTPFNASDQMRRTFMPPSDSYHTLTPEKMADFVFVTAASSNHFAESVAAIAAIQTIMPEKKMLYFDIGLKTEEIAKVRRLHSISRLSCQLPIVSTIVNETNFRNNEYLPIMSS